MKKFLLITTLLLSVAFFECSANQFDCLGDGKSVLHLDGYVMVLQTYNATWPC